MQMDKCKINCFKCDKPLDNYLHPDRGNQPNDGMEFTAYGHYGTIFFDPMNGSTIKINICDECLKANTKNILYREVIHKDLILWDEQKESDK